MKYEFSPNNKVIRLCFEAMENVGDKVEDILNTAWQETQNDFEKFIVSYYYAKNEMDIALKLEWLEKACSYCLSIDDQIVKSSLPSLYLNISKCYETLLNTEKAKENCELYESSKNNIFDNGPFYHGTRANLNIGDMLVAGKSSNYQPDIKMNHIYFTAQISGAGFAADLARGNGKSRIYIVEPTGKFENDPNVTDIKFPGNPTRSYRSKDSLKIIGEVSEWNRLSDEEIKEWHKKLSSKKGKIIN